MEKISFGQSITGMVADVTPNESAGVTLGTCIPDPPSWSGYGCFGSNCGSSCVGVFCAG